MIHKQSVWLTLSVLLVAVLVLAWLANNRPPCLGEAATTSSGAAAPCAQLAVFALVSA
jgi:Ca2+/H+ antiporter